MLHRLPRIDSHPYPPQVFTDAAAADSGGTSIGDFQRAAADADVLLAVEVTEPSVAAAVAEAAAVRTVFLAFDSAPQLQSLIRLKVRKQTSSCQLCWKRPDWSATLALWLP